MNHNKKIIVVGSSNTDMVIKAEHLPNPGETVIGENFLMNFGGKGANQAVAVSRMGGNVLFVCKLGKDFFGSKMMNMLKKEGINTDFISHTASKPSGVALINVDFKGENTIMVASGANSTLNIEDVKNLEKEMPMASILLMQLESPIEVLSYVAKMAKGNGVCVVLNTAPAPKNDLPDTLLQNVDILISNKIEAEIISGFKIKDESSAKIAMNHIASKGICSVIVTMGTKGAYAFQNGKFFKEPAFKVQAIDTTAAGDTFCGAFCEAISENYDFEESILFASKAASLSVTRIGAQISIPYRKEIQDYIIQK